MLSPPAFASSSRSIPISGQHFHRPGPNPLTLNRRIGFSMQSIKISKTSTAQQTTTSASVHNPVQTMFIQYRQKLKDQGRQRLSYPREYKLAAIEQVKSGKSRYIFYVYVG